MLVVLANDELSHHYSIVQTTQGNDVPTAS